MCMHVCGVCLRTSEDQRTILWSSLHSWIWVPGIGLRLSGLPGKRLYPLNHLTGPSTTFLNPILLLWVSLFRAASQFWIFNPSHVLLELLSAPVLSGAQQWYCFYSFKQRANSCFSSVPRVGQLLTQHSRGRTASLPVFFEINTVYTRVPRISHLIMIILHWLLQTTCAVSHWLIHSGGRVLPYLAFIKCWAHQVCLAELQSLHWVCPLAPDNHRSAKSFWNLSDCHIAWVAWE